MTDWRREVKKDSPFLYHWDIEGKTPLDVEIDGWEHKEAFCPGKGEKGVLWCLRLKVNGKQAQKVFGVNMSNGALIAHHHGADKDAWAGKKITLRLAECKGERCIRVDATGARLPKQIPQFRYIDSK